MSRERWMALFFALGSTCFLIGPFPGYAQLVGASADAVTFFIGSILFTAGGALQSCDRVPRAPFRHAPGGRRGGPPRSNPPAPCSSTSRPIRRCTHPCRTPTTTGSCGARTRSARSASWSRARSRIAPRARHGWLPARGRPGWWEPSINLLGCIFFGISAIAGYLVPSTGSLLNLAWANWNTALGAACFLACALATLLTGRTLKSPRLRRLHKLEHAVERDVERIA